MTKFNNVWQTQIIVARNTKGELSRKKLNDALHPMLNPDGYCVAGNPFKVGDKIICTRNSRMHRVEANDAIAVFGEVDNPTAASLLRDAANYEVVYIREDSGDGWQGKQTKDPEEVFVANGEIGRVVAVAKGLTIARFSEGEALVKIPVGKERSEDGPDGDENADQGRGCNFDLAYAVTCHKCQGSEAPCVIIMGDSGGGGIANREWIYTAISRASKLCILVGAKSIFDKMGTRVGLTKRKTFLAELIREMGKETQTEGTVA